MSNDIKSITLLAAFSAENKLFLVQRNGHPRKGYYSFVGGHAHSSERLVDALIREVKEEIGCNVILESDELIRVTGKDNINIDDDFFFNVKDFKQSKIEGMLVEYTTVNTNSIANSIENATNYNLFKGRLVGIPSTSNEVKSFREEELIKWIELIEKNIIKIQPIDYLLLKLLANDRL